jgi:hypothetical protein
MRKKLKAKAKAKIIGVSVLGASLGLAMLTACGKSEGKTVNIKPSIDPTFSVVADIKYGEDESDVLLSRKGDGLWSAEFVSPNTLSGVIIAFDNDNVTANYKGLEFSIPKAAMPNKTIFSDFIDALDKLETESTVKGTVKDGKYLINGKSDQGSYVIELDQKTGNLVGFDMDSLKLDMDFSDYTSTSVKTDGTDGAEKSEEKEEDTNATPPETPETPETPQTEPETINN